MRIRTDRTLCVGAGNCVLSAPEVFDQDPTEGLILLRGAPARGGPSAVGESAVGESEREAVTEAAHLCPSGALTVLDGHEGGSE
jgi:ferredoxin